MLGRPQRRCPDCSEPLEVSRDMWGEFFLCQDCGFAEDDDLAPEAKMTAALLAEEEMSVHRKGLTIERR